MSKKVIVYSGGFDSLCLLLQTHEVNPDIDLLFFDYGQRNLKKELECTKYIAEELDVKLNIIKLPEFYWAKSSCLDKESTTEYVPMRNVIFLSYALSYAESVQAEEIMFGFINPNTEYYKDTSPDFLAWANDFSSKSNIMITAPFIELSKMDLTVFARKFNIKENEFFSCNTPVTFNHGDIVEPCGKCSDCLLIEEIMDEVQANAHIDILIEHDFEMTEECLDELYSTFTKIHTGKLYINDTCNLKCKHCCIPHTQTETNADITGTIDKLVDYGVTTIDFFGKEPLIDDKVFEYARYTRAKYPHVHLMTITNGMTIHKYIDEIVENFKNITISFEKIGDTESRPVSPHLERNIKTLTERGVKVEISMDVLQSNVKDIIPSIKKLSKWGAKSFYVKPIFQIGRTKPDNLVDPTSLHSLMIELSELQETLPNDNKIVFEMKRPHIWELQEHFPNTYHEMIEGIKMTRTLQFRDMPLELEFHCNRYSGMISVTAYGYVLGCGYESLMPQILQVKQGIIDQDLDKTIERGRKKHYFLKNSPKNNCYFN